MSTFTLPEANAVVVLTRTLQGLHNIAHQRPYTPAEVTAACEVLARPASQRLLLSVPVNPTAITQTLDHLADIDDAEDDR